MALDKEQAQGIIDDFVFSNDTELGNIATQNKALFDATINALDFLSKRFGTAQEISKDRVLKMVTVQDELTFKVGDIFRKKNSNDKGFKIKEIDGEKFVFESLTSNMVNSDLYTTSEANKKLKDGNWEKVEGEILPFKVGDKFNFKTVGGYSNNVILEIDPNKDYFEFKNESGSKLNGWTLKEAKQNFESGEWILVKDEQLPFKVGDKIYNKNTPNNIDTIIQIDKETDFFQIKTTDGRKLQGSLKDTIEDVKSGELIVVKDFAFEVGQILFDEETKDELIAIVDVGATGITFIDSEDFVGFKENVVFEKQLKDGVYKFLSFKLDDIFEDENGNKFKIEKLNKSAGFIDIVENYSSNIIGEWESIENSILDGEWVLVNNKQKVEIKVGQIFYNQIENELFEILNIDNIRVTLRTYRQSNTIEIDEFKKQIGYPYILLEFKIGDNFTNGTDNFKIDSLNPNDGRYVIVSINGSNNSMSWDDINDNIQNDTWKPITQTQQANFKFEIGDLFEESSNGKEWVIIDIIKDFDQYVLQNSGGSYSPIQINRIPFEEDVEKGRFKKIFVNQPVTTPKPTPTTKTKVKKTLTKEEKAIKVLQKEIDGLEVMARFDDEAKELLEKKLIEIKALKSKIS